MCDNEINNLFEQLQQLLIDYNYKIIDTYVDEAYVRTSWMIITNKIVIELSSLTFIDDKYKNNLCDEIYIYDDVECNRTSFEYKIKDANFRAVEIFNLIKKNIIPF